MELIEEAEAMADRLETATKGEDAADDCTIDEAAVIIRRMVAELREAQTEVAKLEGDVEGLQFEAQYPRD